MTSWPNGAKAAISFTYDDGHGSCLDFAIPQLESRKFKGSFFITPTLYGVGSRIHEWRDAHSRGHEIGNHSFSHPCMRGELRLPRYLDWRVFASEETGRAEQWLNDNISVDNYRAYAYICGETKLGPGPDDEAESRYLELVQHTFSAARTGGGGPASVEGVLSDRLRIPAQALTWGNNSADKSIEYCQAALRTGGWASLIFHKIGNPSIDESYTSSDVHQTIIDFVASTPENFWVDTFSNVVRYIVK